MAVHIKHAHFKNLKHLLGQKEASGANAKYPKDGSTLQSQGITSVQAVNLRP